MPVPYSYQLKHGPDGRITEKVETVNGKTTKWTYAYDKEGRLSEAKLDGRLICQCFYDKLGRRSQDYFPRTSKQVRHYRYTMDNRLLQAGNNGYTHDKQGFRTLWNSSGKYTLYEYAPDYRLLKVTNEADDIAYEFTHDENGQRQTKLRNGEPVEAYKWLDFVRLAEFHDGEYGYRFAYRENERTPYAMQREDGAIFTLHYDNVGSLRVVADQSGNVIQEILYDPFGGIIENSNPALRIPLGFAGGLHDRDTGLVRFGWRDYDPFTGRWTAPDPMGDAGGDPDWYGYCLDDPVNQIDPLGLFGFLAPYAPEINAAGTWLANEVMDGSPGVLDIPGAYARIVKENVKVLKKTREDYYKDKESKESSETNGRTDFRPWEKDEPQEDSHNRKEYEPWKEKKPPKENDWNYTGDTSNIGRRGGSYGRYGR